MFKCIVRRIGAGLLLCAAALAQYAHAAPADSAWCASGKPVKFAEMGWDSARFMTEVIRYVLEKGYGCKTDQTPGTNAIALQGVVMNDLNVMVEYWSGRTPAYESAAREGKVRILGSLISGGSVEGYYVPEYVIKGDPARGIKPLAAELRSITDLPKYKEVFADEESPSKGRLYNCPIGWQCESDTAQKMKAYKLDDAFTDFHPGSGPALDSAIESAYARGKPILFYYWEPSTILGRFKAVRLAEPAFNEACWKTINGSKDANPCGSASPPTTLRIVVSNALYAADPQIVGLFEKVQFPMESINAVLARMASEKTPPRQAAIDFLKANPDMLSHWVPADVSSKVRSSLQ
ncbi:ABC transporter substrate-binding protein [Paraburkholderia sp. BL10I2N1]|uniref:ABC transporter substrate-binding protein n=1 Tax=Paraburkholderia sp. BL10I2N1 TaxID=1938796 RepID=UPI00105C6813|nr:ABC transporter substrate-binding protein [Paraburkholderia sp. BL10I2N1]TDN63074.1 glycine betaine/proline transport system substrate-binding protein [Paraburkholderia sp. BL10I2N1]